MRLLNSEEIRAALPMDKAINCMKEAFVSYSTGNSDSPLRSRIFIPEKGTEFLVMPAAYQSASEFSLAVKAVAINTGNISRNLPTIHSAVLLADGETGRVIALLEGGALTATRTGATSGLATMLLSNPDSPTLALLGAGTQARTQLEAVCCVRNIEKVNVYSVHSSHAKTLIRECAENPQIPKDIQAVSSPKDAVHDADIICTATTSSTPVFSDRDLSPGVHINAIGAYRPDMQEIPSETVIRSRVFVDSLESVFSEAGDLIIPLREGKIGKDHIIGELGSLVLGEITGRITPDTTTLFKSVGIGVQDAAAARWCFLAAEKEGIGQDIEW